jgi:rubredoxin/uncharacterized membrane protein
MSNWECGVCGYIHKEDGPPEKCPVCEAPAKMFNMVVEEEKEIVAPPAATETRWRCTVCGYIHIGKEPPAKCPVCAAPATMFVEIDANGKTLGEPGTVEAEPAMAALGEKKTKAPRSLFNLFADLVLKLHLHPISVHFPNGILPAVVVFLGISVYFNIVSLETAAYYNLIFVLVMLPAVLLTGYIEWQKRYKGLKTAIFIIKILCALVVLATTNVLVFWRLIDPGVAAHDSPSRFIYLGIAAAMIGAVALAGHLGGKLVFGSRG